MQHANPHPAFDSGTRFAVHWMVGDTGGGTVAQGRRA